MYVSGIVEDQGKLTAPLSANVNVLSATPRLLVPRLRRNWGG
jgi:hypothetical protein